MNDNYQDEVNHSSGNPYQIPKTGQNGPNQGSMRQDFGQVPGTVESGPSYNPYQQAFNHPNYQNNQTYQGGQGYGYQQAGSGNPGNPGSSPSPTEQRSAQDEDDRIRQLVKEEVKKTKTKGSWVRAIVFILIGALLGTGGLAVWNTGIIANHFPTEEQAEAPLDQPKPDINIKLNQDSTVETAVAAKAIPSIVGISCVVKEKIYSPFSFYNGGVEQYKEGVGSGVIIDSNGYILTNSHVVNGGNAEKLMVYFSNDEKAEAKVVWSDETLDMAIIKVEKSGLQAASLGDSDQVQVGDKAIALGNPLGLDLQSTLTSGYISGLNRTITVENSNVMEGLIQTDAAINSGNSGGALLNAHGEVIGINTAKPQAAYGIGFAIPINVAKPIVQKVLEKGSYKPLYMGITGMNVQILDQMTDQKLPTDKGVVINQVVKNSPADKAGLRSGDIITAIDGVKVDSMNSLKTHLLNYKLGDKVKIEIFRENAVLSLDLEFSEFEMEAEKS